MGEGALLKTVSPREEEHHQWSEPPRFLSPSISRTPAARLFILPCYHLISKTGAWNLPLQRKQTTPEERHVDTNMEGPQIKKLVGLYGFALRPPTHSTLAQMPNNVLVPHS